MNINNERSDDPALPLQLLKLAGAALRVVVGQVHQAHQRNALPPVQHVRVEAGQALPLRVRRLAKEISCYALSLDQLVSQVAGPALPVLLLSAMAFLFLLASARRQAVPLIAGGALATLVVCFALVGYFLADSSTSQKPTVRTTQASPQLPIPNPAPFVLGNGTVLSSKDANLIRQLIAPVAGSTAPSCRMRFTKVRDRLASAESVESPSGGAPQASPHFPIPESAAQVFRPLLSRFLALP